MNGCSVNGSGDGDGDGGDGGGGDVAVDDCDGGTFRLSWSLSEMCNNLQLQITKSLAHSIQQIVVAFLVVR